MTNPTSNGALAKALLAAQKDMPAVEPDGVNPHYKSRFVTLGHLLAKTRPVLNKHGISLCQFPSRADDGSPTLTTILLHESGERLEYAAPLFLPKNDPQGQGSAITYLRRYAAASSLGISDQEDDDGNAASTSPDVEQPKAHRLSDKQVGFIVQLAGGLGADSNDQEMIRGYCLENLTAGRDGTGSKTIALLKGEAESDLAPADALVRLVSKAAEWGAKQTDVPADSAGLELGEAA